MSRWHIGQGRFGHTTWDQLAAQGSIIRRPAGLREASMLLDEIATWPAPLPRPRRSAARPLRRREYLGRLARDFLKVVGQDFVLAIDQNARALSANMRTGPACACFIPTRSTKATSPSARLAVSVVTSAYVPIERTLLDRGFTDVVPFYDLAESFRHLHPLSNGWFARRDDGGRPQRAPHGSSRAGMTTYRVPITCNFSPGAGCARNGPSRQRPIQVRPFFHSGRSSPSCATMKSCSTAAPIMAS